jgi:phospho-N-acetylmuramoyl-pentapeptide-transferase
LWAAFWVLAVVGTSNAVNLADGLDGLATGLCAIAAAGFALLGALTGNELVLLLGLALAGACLGFLWFNRHPARVFMGDVGSLALGGALAALAAVLDSPIALLGLCLVPFLELASVVIQVVSFKTTKRRVFKMSPIHHHFELCGWPEQRVVVTFWAVALLAATATVLIPLLRSTPQ